MESNTPIQTAPPTATPATPPAAAAPAPVAPAPVEQTPAPITMETGGATSSGEGFFSKLNYIEVGFSILGLSALAFVVYYYRYKLKQDKMINSQMQKQIDEITANVKSIMKGKYKEMT